MHLQKTGPREIPPDRRCAEVLTSGQPCGSYTVAGEKWCHKHGRYRDLDGVSTIDVPLLEDENALLIVYSQVARTLAQGRIPAAFANGILRACRGAERVLAMKLRREELEERRRIRAEAAAEKSGNQPGNQIPQPKPEELHATPLAENRNDSGCPMSPDFGDMGIEPNGSSIRDMGATSEASAGAPYKPDVGLCGSAGDTTEPNGSSVIRDMGAASSEVVQMEGKWLDLYLNKNREERRRTAESAQSET